MADLSQLSAGSQALLRDKTFLTQGNESGVDMLKSADDDTKQQSMKHSKSQSQLTDSSRLHLALRQLAAMDAQLAETKQRYKERCHVVSQGILAFRERQAATLAYLRRFRPFVIESDTKRQRAERKYADEHRAIQQRTAELAQLKATLQQLQQRRAHVRRRNTLYRSSQTYLESVLLHSDAYSELDELLNRHAILQSTNADLTRDAQIVAAKVEQLHAATRAYSKQQQNALLLLNSRYASLLTQYERSNDRLQSIESDQSASETKSRELQMYIGEIVMSIRHIHMRSGLRKQMQLRIMKEKAMMQQQLQLQQKATSPSAAAEAKTADKTKADSGPVSARKSKDSTTPATEAVATRKTTTAKPKTAHDDDDAHTGEDSLLQSLGHASSSAKLQAHLLQLLDAISDRLADLHYIVAENAAHQLQQQQQQQLLLQAGTNPTAATGLSQQMLMQHSMATSNAPNQNAAPGGINFSTRSLSPHHSQFGGSAAGNAIAMNQSFSHSRSVSHTNINANAIPNGPA